MNYALTSNEDMCLLTYIHNVFDKDNSLKYTDSYRIDLETINPNKVDVRKLDLIEIHYFVKIETKERKPLIINERKYSDKNIPSSRTEKDKTLNEFNAIFYTEDYDAAWRVSKALKHLVTLCGGKDELF